LEWSVIDVIRSNPESRAGHSMTLIPHLEECLVFGGEGESNFFSHPIFNDFYFLNTKTMIWSKLDVKGQIPAPRAGHTATLYDQEEKVLIFGGEGKGEFFNDLFIFDPLTLFSKHLTTTGKTPAKRTEHCVVTYNDYLFVFGGRNKKEYFNDFFRFDPSSLNWEKVKSAHGALPPARSGHSCEIVGNEMLLFGGENKQVDIGEQIRSNLF